jgi:TPR repeat protein
LGSCYYYGTGVTKDEVEAVKWFRKAAGQEYAGAQYNLGVCCQLGTGVTKDEQEAVKWYRKAAEQGDAEAKKALERLGNK